MESLMQTSAALPAPVARYFASATDAPAAVASCFTEDAVILDERQEHRGRSAIAAWNAASNAKYRFTTEPLSSSTEADIVIVTVRVTGTFPGSPAELRLSFTLEGSLIARLEIAS
jgi:ketosteroid isomerase-like protein